MNTNRKDRKEKQPFSKILVSLMSEKGMTVAEAARVAQTSPSTISGWRAGATPEDYEGVQRLANSLGVTLSFLLTGKNDELSASPASVTEVFEEGDFLFDGYAKITIQRLIPRKKVDDS